MKKFFSEAVSYYNDLFAFIKKHKIVYIFNIIFSLFIILCYALYYLVVSGYDVVGKISGFFKKVITKVKDAFRRI